MIFYCTKIKTFQDIKFVKLFYKSIQLCDSFIVSVISTKKMYC